MPQISLYKDTSVSIGERGIDSVSMREIADTAGIQIGSLYQYFPNKELDDKKIVIYLYWSTTLYLMQRMSLEIYSPLEIYL